MADAAPDVLSLNAWTALATASGHVDKKWRSWAATAHSTHDQRKTPQFLKAPEPLNLADWKQIGWGLIVADSEQFKAKDKAAGVDLPEALRELVKSRNGSIFRYRAEHNDLFLRRYFPNDTYDEPETPNWRTKFNGESLPRYLLIWGTPQSVPWSLQYLLNCSAFVGRIDLTGKDLENYVNALMRNFADASCRRDRPLIWATDYGDDDITWLMRNAIAEPISDKLNNDAETKQGLQYFREKTATGKNLAEALAKNTPALILTTSHGMTGPLDNEALMRDKLGLLVDANRQSIEPATLLEKWQPSGAIWYAHACCSAGSDNGTSYQDLLTPGSSAEQTVRKVGELGAQIAPLVRHLLGAAKPLRAFIGHVEPTFDWTLRNPENHEVLSGAILDALYSKMYQAKPAPVSLVFDEYYRQVGTTIAAWRRVLDDLTSRDKLRRQSAPLRTLRTKLIAVDRQSCVILGDPTVCFPAQS